MKKNYNLLIVLGIPAIFLLFTSGVLFHDGSPGGRTGSPGDNGANCTGCHAGTPINQEFWIVSSELIVSGYVPGQTYAIIVSGHDANADKFGFEATAEDNSGNKVGSFESDGFGFTQTINSNEAITHTALGSTPLADTMTFWSFTWTAPATNVGDITMYTAVNAADGNGGNSNDQVYLSQFTFSYSTVGVNEIANEASFKVYPVPSAGILNIANVENLTEKQVNVVNLVGKVVYVSDLSDTNNKLDLSNLEKGIYFVKVGKATQRIILH